MKTKHKIGCVGFVGVLALAYWGMFGPHRFETIDALTSAQAQKKSRIPIPASAANIYVAHYSHWQAMSYYVRFHAPVEVCMAHLDKVVESNEKTWGHAADSISTNDITPASRIDRRPDVYTNPFRSGLPWFDVDKITNGLEAQFQWPFTHVYVDKDRGLFFYHASD